MINKQGQIKATRVIDFIEQLSCSKGKWAKKPLKLLDWQVKELIIPAFSTLRENGLRQYRFVYVEIPKKNGKTELAAAIALYMLCSDGEGKPEIYSVAGDKEQAGLVFEAAKEMVNNNTELLEVLRVVEFKKRIVNSNNSGFYQVLSSESELQHGLSPSCVIVDELHAQPNDRLWNVLTSGTDYARSQQLVLVLTTAGIFDKNSIWWKIRTKAIQVQKGIVKQKNFLPVLYIADINKDDPADEEVWKRVNPALGHIFDMDKIREDYQNVKNDPVEYQNFLRFRLNIPIKQLKRWMAMDKWDSCEGKIDLESLKGRLCVGGLDLAKRIDLNALTLIFPPLEKGGKYIIVTKFYCAEDGILERSQTDRVRYDIWAEQGWITSTPGSGTDYEFIKKDIIDFSKMFELKEIAYDNWNASQFKDEIMEELNPLADENKFQMVEFRQGGKSYNEPMRSFLMAVYDKNILHDDNPVLRWNWDNIVIRQDANENIAPDKYKSTERIDGAVSNLMAWARAIFYEPEVESVYEKDNVDIIL